ncbi:hypothetical protein NBH20_10770, partial [Rhizobium sp. S153]
ARQAHNLKAAGSNPAPATKNTPNKFQSASPSKHQAHQRKPQTASGVPAQGQRTIAAELV